MPGPSAIPGDAPTVVRPDLASMTESDLEAMMDAASVPSSLVETEPATETFSASWDAEPAGEATVALKSPLASTTPEQSLPGSASYSPPTENAPTQKMAPAPPSEAAPTQKMQPEAAPALDAAAPTKKMRPSEQSIAPRSGDGGKKRKKSKKVQVAKRGEKFDDEGGIQPLHIAYGVVIAGGLLLVFIAFIAGLVILTYMPTGAP